MYETVKTIYYHNVKRINIVLQNIQNITDEDLLNYKNERLLIADYIEKEKSDFKVNVLSDLFNSKEKNTGCGAGIDSYTVAPNGKLYICSGFYFGNENRCSIGDLDNGFSFDYKNSLYKRSSIECASCKN